MNNLKIFNSSGGGRGMGGGRGTGGGRGMGGGRHQDHDHDHEHGEGRGRNNGGGFGPGGYCVCAKCGEKIEHKAGVKCTDLKCPKCGHTMVREELLNTKKSR